MNLNIKHLEWDGFTIEYNDYYKPDAPVLLFLHSIKSSKELFQQTLPAFFDHYRVIAIDIRGHGHSSKQGPYSFSQIVDDILHVIDHEGINQVSIIAASFSCVPAQMFAVTYPERVHNLVLLDGGYFNLFDVPGFDLKKEVNKYQEQKKEDGLPVEALESYFTEYGTFDKEKVFSLIECPVLLLLADEKKLANQNQQQFFISAADKYITTVRNARSIKIPDSLHLLMLSNPEETIAHIQDFLKEKTPAL